MMKRITAMFITVAMVMTVVTASSVAAAYAAGAEYEAPVKVETYYNDSESDVPVWKLDSTTEYQYNAKGNVSAVGKFRSKWKYDKKGRVVKVTTGSKKQKARSVYTYKKGRIRKGVVTFYRKGKAAARGNETYVVKNGWIRKYTEKIKGVKYTVKYSYTFYADGMPKSLTVSDKVKGSTGKTTVRFNELGLVTVSKSKYDKTSINYKLESGTGRVSEKIVSIDGMGPMYRTVYTYSGAKNASQKTYVGVMNDDFLLGAARDAVPSPYGLLAK